MRPLCLIALLSLHLAPTHASGTDPILEGASSSAEAVWVGDREIVRQPVLHAGIPIRGLDDVTIRREGHSWTRRLGKSPDLLPLLQKNPPLALWSRVEGHLADMGIPADGWSAAPGVPERAWLMDGDGSLVLAIAHRVHVFAGDDEFELWLDSATGTLLERASIRRHGGYAGEVLARIPDGNLPYSPSATLIHAPLAGLTITPGGEPPVDTGPTGIFTIPSLAANLFVNAELVGAWVDVQNQGGPDSNWFGSLSAGMFGTILFGDPASEFTVAEGNAFYVVSRSRNWLLDHAAGLPAAEFPVVVHVNVAGSCYSAYLPIFQTIQLTRAGNGCRNSAYGTLLAHEYFHHIEEHIPGVAEFEVEEANADIFAAFCFDDPRIGPDFETVGTSLRDLEPDAIYPVASSSAAIRGLPLSGAFWDLRTELIASLGMADGADAAAELWLTWVLAGSGELDASLLSEMIELDDDDGDLSNGTPHLGELLTAFPPHGFDLPLLPVENLLCHTQEQGAVLSWTLPALGMHDSIEVRRGGASLATLPASATDYLDPQPPPGLITYAVVARLGSLGAPSPICGLDLPAVQMFIRGDVSGEGSLDLSDAIQLLGYLFQGNPWPTCFDALDVNDSGSIDIGDALRLLRYTFGIDSPPEPPFPDPGFDPTPDTLLCL